MASPLHDFRISRAVVSGIGIKFRTRFPCLMPEVTHVRPSSFLRYWSTVIRGPTGSLRQKIYQDRRKPVTKTAGYRGPT